MFDPNQTTPITPSPQPETASAQPVPSDPAEQTAPQQAPPAPQASAPEMQPPVPPVQAAQQPPFQAPPQPNYTAYTPGGYAQQPPYPPANYQPPYPQNYYTQPAPPPPPPGYPQPPAYPPYPQQKYKPEGLAIACMVLGICSIPLGSLICAILALVFASRVKSHYPNGNLGPNTNYVKAGRICGIIGLVFWVVIVVLLVVCLIIAAANGALDYHYNFSYYINN